MCIPAITTKFDVSYEHIRLLDYSLPIMEKSENPSNCKISSSSQGHRATCNNPSSATNYILAAWHGRQSDKPGDNLPVKEHLPFFRNTLYKCWCCYLTLFRRTFYIDLLNLCMWLQEKLGKYRVKIHVHGLHILHLCAYIKNNPWY